MFPKNRLLSMVLALALLLSLLPFPVQAAGRSFSASELYCSETPFSVMPNTLEAWVYFPASTAASSRGGVILGNYHEKACGVFSFEVYTNGNPRLYYADSAGHVTGAIFTDINVYNGTWTHLAMVRNESAGTVTCYVNGSPKQTLAVKVESAAPMAAPVLGGDYRSGNGQYFKGQLRSVSAYADARTAAEVKEDMVSPGYGDLLALWDVSTKADNYTDLSGNGYDVKLSSLGKSFRADELYTLSKPLATMPNTMEAWVHFPTTAGGDRGGVILGNYNTGGGVLSFEIHKNGSPRLYYIDKKGTISDSIFSNVSVCTGKWEHIALVRDASAGKVHCYLNGTLSQSLDMKVEEFIPTNALRIGGDFRPNNVQYFKGRLRSVALYADVRTAAEIKEDMNTLANGDPLAVWDLRAHSSAYADLSGGGYKAQRSTLGLSFRADETYNVSKKFSQLPNTVEAWIHFPKDMADSTRGGVILGNYSDGGKGLFNVEIHANGIPRMYYVDNSGTVTNKLFTSVNVYTGQWLHLAVVRDSSAKKAHCYVNGTLAQSLDLNISAYAPGTAMVVGGDLRNGNAQNFKGQIRSVAVYSDARSSTEVAADMNRLGNGDPIAVWNMAAAAQSYSDNSGNGFHLNLSSMWFRSKEAPTDYDYTFAVVGDTQKITYYDYQNGTKHLNKIYDWILSKQEERNIEYVMGLGDITEKGTIDAEWELALGAINKLNGKIPYSLVRGNHDNSAKMNLYLKDLSKTPYSTTYAGSYDGTVNNTWRTIKAGSNGIPYLIFCLDYGPTDAILSWAGKIITEHPDHNVIITTHAYLFRDGTTLDSGDVCPPSDSNAAYNNGDQVWEKFVRKYENIVLVLSGHDPCNQVVVRTDTADHGNRVTQMLIDPQGMDTTTLTGAVALLHFSADGRKVSVEYYSTIQEKYFMSSNQFTMELDGVEPIVDKSITIGHSLNLASEISINYAVPAAQLASYDSFYLECRVPVYTGNLLTGEQSYRIEATPRGDRYYFTMNGLLATQMNDNITATLHMSKDGVQYLSQPDIYSIASYAYKQLDASSATAALKKVCADLLQYGATAQLWKGYRTDCLATAAMTATQKSYLTDTETVTFGNCKATLSDLDNPSVIWLGRGLSLENKIVVRFIFSAGGYLGNPEELSLELSYVNHRGEAVTKRIYHPKVYNQSNDSYVFDVDVLDAADMRQVLSVAVYAGQARLSRTAQYSIDTYGMGKTGTLLALCKAMVAYGDSAAAFFK